VAVVLEPDGKLRYSSDERGNQIPDFSVAGYRGGEEEIPDVPVRVVVAPADGDDGARIQAAIDHVASLTPDKNGFRGAVRLAPGKYQVAGHLSIRSSGIVLQGSGAHVGGTVVLATGTDRRALVQVRGRGAPESMQGTDPQPVATPYVPVGATQLEVVSAAGFSVGDQVLVTRPSTAEWIAAVGGRAHGVAWKPGSRDLVWDRQVRAVAGNTLTLDAPITTALDEAWGGGTVERYQWPGRIESVGVEDLCLRSDYRQSHPLDEDHSWYGISIDAAQNAWVRRITLEHFAGGGVSLGQKTRAITVEDCVSREPVSEIGGYRRHTFFTMGQTTLFHRCWSEQGRHDFSVGHCAAGPNAFVQCHADQALAASGPIESWAAGVLYDNVRIDGNDLQLENHWNSPPETGWSAANCVLWQCRASGARCFRPPGANNWSIGVWATPAGDGTLESISDFVKPHSLFQAQLRARLGDEAAKRLQPMLGKSVAATSPTYEEAARFVEQSREPVVRLIDVIQDHMAQVTNERIAQSIRKPPADAVTVEEVLSRGRRRSSFPRRVPTPERDLTLKVENGWLVVDGRVRTGGRVTPTWWRGNIRPAEAPSFGTNISRFAPGRVGLGLTEEVPQVAKALEQQGVAVYEHHYGLWYDRRRDDHLMVRRATGDVAPPFYEQPFARSGQGTAWDGLSKYDLSQPNPWYWNRLSEFARQCDDRGMVLVHQAYFQHNILEAGAHWADCPWRPANNINDTGLPEPPPYIGDKRLFMAPRFYDPDNAALRKLHRAYIRQCLEAFGDSTNVLQMTSAEYTGPLEFAQFWLDTIVEWEAETGRNVLIALSCTKDVQDAILDDAAREPHVDVIDIRYWTFDKNFEPYAPTGDAYLAPRQHMRQLQPEAASFASIAEAVGEYRRRFPAKPVLYNADRFCRSGNEGWAVLMGGGSLANVRLPEELAARLPSMQPADGKIDRGNAWCLADSDREFLTYFEKSTGKSTVRVSDRKLKYEVRWLDLETGEIVEREEIETQRLLHLKPESCAVWITRLED
jgi:hypothetical protein